MQNILREQEAKESEINSFFEEMKFEVLNLGEDNVEFEKENLLKMLNQPS